MSQTRLVHIQTLGCSRNETDSDELAARLTAAGWELTSDENMADAILVNTCGFIDAAKKDSIDAIVAASDLKETGKAQAVVAVGCMAERYGEELAAELTEADAVLGFDSYQNIGQQLREIVEGARPASHKPIDRRTLLSKSPIDRANALSSSESEVLRVRLDSRPYAPLKIASGCDRRCSFCAIPRFRGAFVSRRPTDIISEAAWLAERGVKEVMLVSENSTSYGKDFGDMKLMESLLPALAVIPNLRWIRLSYLQPAEMRPTLIEAIASTPGVVPYFDMSFQHSAPAVLRRMRRFGGSTEFLELISQIRQQAPAAAIRSNLIVGFPGESEADFAELCEFVSASQLDAIGIFGYSDENDTEAETFTDKLPTAEINRRVDYITSLVDEVVSQRAEDRVGSETEFLVESTGNEIEGRVMWQGPEVDGTTRLITQEMLQVGDILKVRIVDTEGADLIAEAL
jgi:ribosomal protein S12 methylthiotransferase